MNEPALYNQRAEGGEGAPFSLPFIWGSTRATALAAPVVVGTMFRAAARARRRSRWEASSRRCTGEGEGEGVVWFTAGEGPGRGAVQPQCAHTPGCVGKLRKRCAPAAPPQHFTASSAHLVAGVGVGGGHGALDNAKLLVQHLNKRRQAVGGARRVGNDGVRVLVVLW